MLVKHGLPKGDEYFSVFILRKVIVSGEDLNDCKDIWLLKLIILFEPNLRFNCFLPLDQFRSCRITIWRQESIFEFKLLRYKDVLWCRCEVFICLWECTCPNVNCGLWYVYDFIVCFVIVFCLQIGVVFKLLRFEGKYACRRYKQI